MKKCVRTAICGGPEELEDVMTNDDYIVGITLEDYSVPRSKNAVTLYCGTVYELGDFLDAMYEKDWVRERYSQMFIAFTNTTREKSVQYPMCGKDYPTRHGMYIIYTQENFLNRHWWKCTAYDNSIYSFFVERAIVNYVLAYDALHLYRFIRTRFTGLQVNLQGQGWVKVKDQFQGFPCVYTYDEKLDEHIMNLHICDEIYDEYDQKRALRELKEMREIDLTRATQDLLGEGFI